jgi:hypothetical protein
MAAWWRDGGALKASMFLVALAVAGLLAMSLMANHFVQADVAMYLHSGELLLDGQQPYIDFVEVNPPMTMYLSVIPVAVARLAGTPLVETFYVLVTLLSCVGAWSLWRWMDRIMPDLHHEYRWLMVSAWFGFQWLVFHSGHVILAGTMVGTDFGQREHFFALGYIPFMLLRWRRWEQPEAKVSLAEALFMGVLGGVTMWIKPHFAVVATAVELQFLVARGRWRTLLKPETLVAAAIGVAYLAHFFVVPVINQQFIHRWLPLAASRYRVYHFPWAHVFNLDTLRAVVVLVLAYYLPWREPYRRFIQKTYPLAGFCVAGTVAMISQHKGWPYHLIPIIAGLWLFVGLIAVQVMQYQDENASHGTGKLHEVQRVLIAVRPQLLAALFIMWGVSIYTNTKKPFRDHRSKSYAFIQQNTTRDDSVLWIATSVPLIYPEMLLSGRKPGSRYLWTFPIAYLFEGHDAKKKIIDADFYDPPPGREAEEATLIAELLEDVDQRKPKLVFVFRRSGCQACPPWFNLLSYSNVNGFIFGLEERDYRAAPDYVGDWSVWLRQDVELAE